MKKKRTITFSLHALFFQKNAIFSCKQSNHRAHLANLIKNKAVNHIHFIRFFRTMQEFFN